MMSFDYSELDNEILTLISEGVNTAAQLVSTTKAPFDPETKDGRYRAVDRRLQALRRRKKIVFDTKTGWRPAFWRTQDIYMKPFTDKSSASRIEKAKRVLRSLSNPHDYGYFFGDGFPRHSELQSDAAATLEVLESMERSLANVNSTNTIHRHDAAEPYIRPRKKVDNETLQQGLARRLEEYIEYAHAARRFADVGFYEELLRYVEAQQRGRQVCLSS